MAVKVKICGVTRVEDALAACELGADMIGLNFFRSSPRAVELDAARVIAQAVAGRGVALVGVFVNSPRQRIEEIRLALNLDLLQFHGDEDNQAVSGWPLPVIRAWRVRGDRPLEWRERPAGDYVLLDRYDHALFGGTGRALPNLTLRGFDLGATIISGGLRPDTVSAAAALKPWAVDVASGVERAPGIKDHVKMKEFISNAKSA
jgi:phosphoribosylanthranilate isomerase